MGYKAFHLCPNIQSKRGTNCTSRECNRYCRTEISRRSEVDRMPARSTLNSSSLWFEGLSKSLNPSLRLFCFPYAGGSAELFRSWQQWFLDCGVEICLVHLPGRGRRVNEAAFTCLGSLI